MAENQGIAVPGEEEGQAANPEIDRQQKVEARARKGGWKPIEEFDGDEADWIEAKEFVAREPLYKKIHNLTNQIEKQSQKFDSDMRVISGQFSQMSEIAYKKALSELKADRVMAIKDQDIEVVEAIDEQIKDIEKEREKAKPVTRTTTPTASPELVDWKTQNLWFEKDKEMTDDAVSIGVGYLAAHQGTKTQAQMLEYVEKKIKQMYPEKFNKKAKVEEKDQDLAVEASGSVNRPAGGKKKFSVSDLSDDEKQVMKTFISRGVLKDIAAKNKRSEQEEYIAQLADAKAR